MERLALTEEYCASRLDVLTNLVRQQYAVGKRDLVFAEVGVLEGRLPYFLLRRFPTLHYIGIDPYRYNFQSMQSDESGWRDQGVFDGEDDNFTTRYPSRNYETALEDAYLGAMMKISAHPIRAQLWKMTSKEGSYAVPDRALDMVFIDGDHQYEAVRQDIRMWLPKVKIGGYIAGHDFGRHEGVTRAVCEYRMHHGGNLHLEMDSVWYWKVDE